MRNSGGRASSRPGKAEREVEAGHEQAERRAGEVARQPPLVVALPHAQGALAGGQRDDAGEHDGVGEEVDAGGGEGGQHTVGERGRERHEGDVQRTAEERREHVVGDVEDDLLRVAREPDRREAGGDGHEEGGEEAEDDQRGQDEHERQRHHADAGQADLAQVDDGGEGDEGDEGRREGTAAVVGQGQADHGRGDHAGHVQ